MVTGRQSFLISARSAPTPASHICAAARSRRPPPGGNPIAIPFTLACPNADPSDTASVFFSTNRTQRKILNPSGLAPIPRPPCAPHLPHTSISKNKTPHQKTTSAKQKSSPCIPFGTQGELLFQLRSDGSNYAVLPRCGLIICTARPDGSDARNEPRRPPGSWRTAPWHAPGRRGSGGCNGSRWPGTPDTCPCCQPWR